MKIYAVEKGVYSNYRVVGIFSTRENAEKIASIINRGRSIDNDPATIAEWQLDPNIKEMNAGLNIYSIQMDYGGAVVHLKQQKLSEDALCNGLTVWKRTEPLTWKDKSIMDCVCGSVWAKNDLHAVKIANEFRTQAIAEGKMTKRELPLKKNKKGG